MLVRYFQNLILYSIIYPVFFFHDLIKSLLYLLNLFTFILYSLLLFLKNFSVHLLTKQLTLYFKHILKVNNFIHFINLYNFNIMNSLKITRLNKTLIHLTLLILI